MKVNLVCFSSLARQDTCDYRDSTSYDLIEGQTLGDLVDQAGIPRREVKIALVNRRMATFDTVLAAGDRIGLAPAVGGM